MFIPGCYGCNCNPCPSTPLGSVLLWNHASNSTHSAEYTIGELYNLYLSAGFTVKASHDWSGTLSDYFLIIWPAPTSDPSWWGQISGGTWTGRLMMLGEWGETDRSGFYDDINDYIDSKTGLHGMSIGLVDNSPVAPSFGNVFAHDLTQCVTNYQWGFANEVIGGTPLAEHTDGSSPSSVLIAQNKVGTIDWIICGDSSSVTNGFGHTGYAAANEQFLINLGAVALP